MKTYTVPVELINPVAFAEFEVEAKDEKDAIKKAKEKYQSKLFWDEVDVVQYEGLDWKSVTKNDVWES